MQNCEEFTPDVKVTDFNFFIMHNFFVNFTERNVKKRRKKERKEKRNDWTNSSFQGKKSKLIKIAINE